MTVGIWRVVVTVSGGGEEVLRREDIGIIMTVSLGEVEVLSEPVKVSVTREAEAVAERVSVAETTMVLDVDSVDMPVPVGIVIELVL